MPRLTPEQARNVLAGASKLIHAESGAQNLQPDADAAGAAVAKPPSFDSEVAAAATAVAEAESAVAAAMAEASAALAPQAAQ